MVVLIGILTWRMYLTMKCGGDLTVLPIFSNSKPFGLRLNYLDVVDDHSTTLDESDETGESDSDEYWSDRDVLEAGAKIYYIEYFLWQFDIQ